MTRPHHDRFVEIVRAAPSLMTVLGRLQELSLPDMLVMSGAIYQTVWNALTGRPAEHGLTRFVCPAFAVGVRLEQDGSLKVAAPFGLNDIFAMRLRPNALAPVSPDWSAIVASVVPRWPEASVAPGV